MEFLFGGIYFRKKHHQTVAEYTNARPPKNQEGAGGPSLRAQDIVTRMAGNLMIMNVMGIAEPCHFGDPSFISLPIHPIASHVPSMLKPIPKTPKRAPVAPVWPPKT